MHKLKFKIFTDYETYNSKKNLLILGNYFLGKCAKRNAYRNVGKGFQYPRQ